MNTVNPRTRLRSELTTSVQQRSIFLVTSGLVALAVLFFALWQLEGVEICDNGIDDDGDGWIDVADYDCGCITAPATAARFTQLNNTRYLGMSDCREAYQLTPASNNQKGVIWYPTRLDLRFAFDMTFAVLVGQRDDGADGLSFALHRDARGLSASGGGGGDLGISGITPSVFLEIDTWDNGTADPSQDHLAFGLNGNVWTHVAGPATFAYNIEDSKYHLVRITWNPATTQLDVYFDDLGTVYLSYSKDLIKDVFGNETVVYFGWTAATGGARNDQQVHTVNMQFSPEGTPFPVEWLGFEAQQQGTEVALDWATATELNSDYFVVERSRTAGQYEEIGRVQAAGTTDVPQHYTFVDANPMAPAGQVSLHYRLRQVDFDGAFSYSSIREVAWKTPGTASGLQAYPNPAQTWVTVVAPSPGHYELEIRDIQGRTLYRGTIEDAHQAPRQQVPVASWPRAMYVIQLRGATQVYERRLVVE